MTPPSATCETRQVQFPDQSLLVCANQRSGSTMLSRALADTHVAGRPEEYFLTVDPVQFPEFQCWEDGPFARPGMSRTEYLSEVYQQGTTDNGVFAAKLMWNCVDLAAAAFNQVQGFANLDRRQVFERAFPRLKAVVLTRRDRLAQAVSWARADQENVWVIPIGDGPARPTPPLVYDGELIGNLVRLIERFEPLWPAFLDELGASYIRLDYEHIVADLPAAVQQVCDLLEVEVDQATLAKLRPRTVQQADDVNQEWIERFRRESTRV